MTEKQVTITNRINLIVRKQPPQHVFSEEWFDVEFGLDVISSTSMEAPSDEFINVAEEMKEYAVILCSYNEVKESSQSKKDSEPQRESLLVKPYQEDGLSLTAQPSVISFRIHGTPPRRKQKVRCHIRKDDIPRKENLSYCLQLLPKNIQDQPSSLIAGHDTIHTMPITLVNYKLKVDIGLDWERIWYKDEGGRDKSMTLMASLCDRDGKIKSGDRIPLELALYYYNDGHSPLKVMKQDILRSIGAGKEVIHESTGSASLRFRIEDVSKNHQGQDFMIEVAPIHHAGCFQDVAPGFSPSVSVRSKRNKRQRSSHYDRLENNAGTPDRRSSSKPTSTATGEDPTDSDPGVPPATPIRDATKLGEALRGVIQWTEEVLNGVASLQWQVLGYHQGPDGNPDYNRPYHNIPRPDAVISRIVGMYSDTTREQLMVLVEALNRNPSDSLPAQPPSISRLNYDDAYHAQQHHYNNQHPYHPLYPHHTSPPPYATTHHTMVARNLAANDSSRIPHDATTGPQIGIFPGTHPQQPQQPMMNSGMGYTMPSYSRPGMQNNTRRSHYSDTSHSIGNPPPLPVEIPIPHLPTSPSHLHAFESEVFYVLAKNYQSIHTGEYAGFPAYSRGKELVGFYFESQTTGMFQFNPIQRYEAEMGPVDRMLATDVLRTEIQGNSKAVYRLKDWGSISNLLGHAAMFDWNKE